MKKILFGLLIALFPFLAIGQDTLRYSDLNTGERVRGDFDHYLSKSGDIYSVGDTITILRPGGASNVYQHIAYRVGLDPSPALGSEHANQATIIRSISARGSRRGGFSAAFRLSGRSFVETYYVSFENALEIGEIRGKGISRDEAIRQLTEAKQLFDIDVISEEEYDDIRERLTPIIRGEK